MPSTGSDAVSRLLEAEERERERLASAAVALGPERMNPSSAAGAAGTGYEAGPGADVSVSDAAEMAKDAISEAAKAVDASAAEASSLAIAASLEPYWVPDGEKLVPAAHPSVKARVERPGRAESEGSGTSPNAPESADKEAANKSASSSRSSSSASSASSSRS